MKQFYITKEFGVIIMKAITLQDIKTYLERLKDIDINYNNQYLTINNNQPLYLYFDTQKLNFTDDTETFSKIIKIKDSLPDSIKDYAANTLYANIKNIIYQNNLILSLTHTINLSNDDYNNLDTLNIEDLDTFEIIYSLPNNSLNYKDILLTVLNYQSLFNNIHKEYEIVKHLTPDNYKSYTISDCNKPEIELD